MLGAIIGDIVGSRFEFNNHRSMEFDLFTKECFVTDDSIMSLAVAKSIIETSKTLPKKFGDSNYNFEINILLEKNTIKYMQLIGREYPNCGYGGRFGQWIFSEDPQPYESYGNGAAMRISPVGCIALSESDAIEISEIITAVTHDHDEGIKGAEATAIAIVMAKNGFTKNEIRDEIVSSYYNIDFTLDEIRDTYSFNETCQDTVPQALEAFFESVSFEDSIRKAISIGGDSDTLAAITGSIAEAYYGIPEGIREKAISYLDSKLLAIYEEWCEFTNEKEVFKESKVITKYIGKLDMLKSFGEFDGIQDGIGTYENPYVMPYMNIKEVVREFEKEFYEYSEAHPEFALTGYDRILSRANIEWSNVEMRRVDDKRLDKVTVLALNMGVIRAERFSSGTLVSFLEDGYITKWLKRLYEIDSKYSTEDIKEINFEIGGYGGYDQYNLKLDGDIIVKKTIKWLDDTFTETLSIEETNSFLVGFKEIQVEYWNYEYIDKYICDGTGWTLNVTIDGIGTISRVGHNMYPENWNELEKLFGIEVFDEEE